MQWRLPAGAVCIGSGTVAHPREDHGGYYWKLIRFEATGEYRLLGMAGEVRSCPQDWARRIVEGKGARHGE